MTHRTTARVVGSLFILGSIAGLVGAALEQPIIDASDYLTKVSLNENRLATGVLLELVMGLALVGVAVAIYPILKRFSERLAVGYVAARAVESVIYVLSAVGLLTLLTVGHDYVSASGADAGQLQRFGDLLLAQRDWAGSGVQDAAVFTVSALILNYLLYRARLVPRWLSLWGLIGAAMYLAAGVMVIYGLEPFSTTQVVMDVPLGVQEMALALWLIIKGFNPAAFASEAVAG